MVTLRTRFDTRDQVSADGVKRLLRELNGKVRSETGHLSYQTFSTKEETTCWVLESWETQADADRHGELVMTNGTVHLNRCPHTPGTRPGG
ncbi:MULTISPECIES: putative quinol monooxygenase [unclassified Lysobacter]